VNEIILSAEQAAMLALAEGWVAVRHPDGRLLGWIETCQGFVTPEDPVFTDEQVAAAELRELTPGPVRTTQEVLARLRAIDRSQQDSLR
jgi:hypothetical protein